MNTPALAVLTPDGGGRVITDPMTFSELRGLGVEMLQWLRVASSPLDDEITVLAAWDEGIVEACFKLGEAWHYCHNGAECETPPTHWAEWPAGPQC